MAQRIGARDDGGEDRVADSPKEIGRSTRGSSQQTDTWRAPRRDGWKSIRLAHALNPPVNTCPALNGETRELVRDNVGFGLNHGVELAPPRRLLSNWRDCQARKHLRTVAYTDKGVSHRWCQDNGRGNLVRGRYGSPAWIRTTINDLSCGSACAWAGLTS